MSHRSMMRLVALVLGVSMVALGGAAASAVSPASTHHGPKLGLIHKGYLTVGSDETYPPMESQNTTTGKAVGADVDLGNAVARAIGLKGARFMNVTFDDLIPELTGIHPFDVIMSSMNDTPGRRSEGVAFVDYLKAVEAIVVRKSSKVHANSYLGVCGLTVSVENGTTEQASMQAANKKCKKKINIRGFETDTEAFQAFVSHDADAYTTDYPVAALYVKLNKKSYRLAGKVIETGQEYGIGLCATSRGHCPSKKEDKALLNAVRAGFKKVQRSGKYLKILKKYHLAQGKI